MAPIVLDLRCPLQTVNSNEGFATGEPRFRQMGSLHESEGPRTYNMSGTLLTLVSSEEKHFFLGTRPVGAGYTWLWVRNAYPKRNPGKWNQRLKPAVPWWFYFDPYPHVSPGHIHFAAFCWDVRSRFRNRVQVPVFPQTAPNAQSGQLLGRAGLAINAAAQEWEGGRGFPRPPPGFL